MSWLITMVLTALLFYLVLINSQRQVMGIRPQSPQVASISSNTNSFISLPPPKPPSLAIHQNSASTYKCHRCWAAWKRSVFVAVGGTKMRGSEICSSEVPALKRHKNTTINRWTYRFCSHVDWGRCWWYGGKGGSCWIGCVVSGQGDPLEVAENLMVWNFVDFWLHPYWNSYIRQANKNDPPGLEPPKGIIKYYTKSSYATTPTTLQEWALMTCWDCNSSDDSFNMATSRGDQGWFCFVGT